MYNCNTAKHIMLSKWYTVYTLFLNIPTVDKTVTLSNGIDSILFTQFINIHTRHVNARPICKKIWALRLLFRIIDLPSTGHDIQTKEYHRIISVYLVNVFKNESEWRTEVGSEVTILAWWKWEPFCRPGDLQRILLQDNFVFCSNFTKNVSTGNQLMISQYWFK